MGRVVAILRRRRLGARLDGLRAVGGRGGPKRRPRSKSADGDVEAPADEAGEADIVEKEEGGCRIA